MASSNVVENVADAESSPPPKTIVLRCNDGEEFLVEESLAKLGSQTVSNLIEDLWMIPCCEEMMVPLPNVRGPSMAKIIVYWKKHQEEDHNVAGEMEKWDSEFVAGMDRDDLIEHLTSAHDLECQPLVDLLSQGLSDMIKDMMKVEDVTDYSEWENMIKDMMKVEDVTDYSEWENMIKDMMKVEDVTYYFEWENDFSDEQEEKKLMEQNA